jgi:hypothetical protein
MTATLQAGGLPQYIWVQWGWLCTGRGVAVMQVFVGVGYRCGMAA